MICRDKFVFLCCDLRSCGRANIHFPRAWCLIGLFLSFCFANGLQAVAQVQANAAAKTALDDDDWDEEVPAQEIDIAGMVGGRITRQGLRESLFNAVGGSEPAFQKLRRENIMREIDRIDRICELTADQKAKLNEAIEIDIQHVTTRIENLLSSFDSKMTQLEYGQLYQSAAEAISQLDSVMGASAIWRKVLRSQLSSDQFKKIDDDETQVLMNIDRTKRYKALLSLQRKLGLTANQRAQMDKWLVNEEARFLDSSNLWRRAAASDGFKAILTPQQLLILKQPLPETNQVRGQGQMMRIERAIEIIK